MSHATIATAGSPGRHHVVVFSCHVQRATLFFAGAPSWFEGATTVKGQEEPPFL